MKRERERERESSLPAGNLHCSFLGTILSLLLKDNPKQSERGPYRVLFKTPLNFSFSMLLTWNFPYYFSLLHYSFSSLPSQISLPKTHIKPTEPSQGAPPFFFFSPHVFSSPKLQHSWKSTQNPTERENPSMLLPRQSHNKKQCKQHQVK